MYSLLTLLTLIATYELVLLLETRRIKHLLLYLVTSLSSIATFPLSASLLLAQNAAVFFSVSRRELRRWVMAEALFVLPCVPLFVYALHNLRYLAPETSTYPSPLGVIGIIGTFSLSATGPAGSPTWYAFYAYTFCSLALIGFGIVQVRRTWNGHTWRHLLLVLWLVIPLTLTAALARITGAQWTPRYVIYASPAYFLLLGLSVQAIRDRRIRYLAAAAILAFPALRLIRYYERPSRPQWREAVQFVQRNERHGDVIAIYRPGNGVVFEYYYRGKQPWLEDRPAEASEESAVDGEAHSFDRGRSRDEVQARLAGHVPVRSGSGGCHKEARSEDLPRPVRAIIRGDRNAPL